MIQVYTGNGKGKTTASMGLTLRALGAGMQVMYIQFMKAKGYSEQKILSGFAPQLTLEAVGKPFFIAPEGAIETDGADGWKAHVVVFPPGQPPADYVAMIDEGMERTAEALSSGAYDLVVLDEINMALHFGLIQWPKLERMLDRKAAHTEVVLTGRGATAELIAKADLVTEMREIKHYYQEQGLEARLGIEN